MVYMVKKYIVPLLLVAGFIVTGIAQIANASTQNTVTFVPSLPDAQVGVAYTPTNLVLTGISIVSVSATNVPAGMSVSSGGVLTGSPTTAGTYLMDLSATDITGATGTGTVSLIVAAATTSPCKQPGNHYGNGGDEDDDDVDVPNTDAFSTFMDMSSVTKLKNCHRPENLPVGHQ